MRKTLCVLFVLAVITLPTFAQKATVFTGYSYLNADVSETKDLQTSANPTTRINLNGWNAQAAYLFTPHFAMAADFGGYYGTPKIDGAEFKTKGHTFLFGPAFVTKTGKFMPSAHFLVGATKLTATEKTSNLDAVNGTHFTYAIGGGLDYIAAKHVAIRVAQVDYLRTKLSLTKDVQQTFGLTDAKNWQNNVRYSGGLVFIF